MGVEYTNLYVSPEFVVVYWWDTHACLVVMFQQTPPPKPPRSFLREKHVEAAFTESATDLHVVLSASAPKHVIKSYCLFKVSLSFEHLYGASLDKNKLRILLKMVVI